MIHSLSQIADRNTSVVLLYLMFSYYSVGKGANASPFKSSLLKSVIFTTSLMLQTNKKRQRYEGVFQGERRVPCVGIPEPLLLKWGWKCCLHCQAQEGLPNCSSKRKYTNNKCQRITIQIFQGEEASEPIKDTVTTPEINASPTTDYYGTCGSKLTDNLDDVGDMWKARFEELTAYKQKHGHCLVPKKSRSNPQLGIWVMNQRAQYKLLQEKKPSTMMPERFQALQKLGFVWSIKDHVDWEDRFEELIDYKMKYGDCLVPNKFADNPQLGTWVNKQRTHYKWMLEGKPNSMTKERARALEGIGFVWSQRDFVDWYSRLEELKMYKQEQGHCNVPSKYSPNPQLGTWAMHQRAHYRKFRQGKPSPMTEERVQALEEIGFTWSICYKHYFNI